MLQDDIEKNEVTRKKIDSEKQQHADLYLKSSALYANLRKELAIGISIFPESENKNLLKQIVHMLDAKEKEEPKTKLQSRLKTNLRLKLNTDQDLDDYRKVKKTLLKTLDEENDPTRHYYAAAFSIINSDISRHIKKALAQLTSQSTALSTKKFFYHILQLIQLVNQTLAINYQTTEDQNKKPQAHIAYKTLKTALRVAAKHAIKKLTDEEIVTFIENRDINFTNQVAVMPLQHDGHLDNITAEFIFELLESHVAKRYQKIKPEEKFHPQYPNEKNLISIAVQSRALNFYFNKETQEAFSSCMENAEENLRGNAHYANNIKINKSELKKIKEDKAPEQFLRTLGMLTKMFVRDCKGDLTRSLKKFSLLLQLNPQVTVKDDLRKQANEGKSTHTRDLAQNDIEYVIKFCNSHNFTELLNYLETYLPNEGAHTYSAVRVAMASLKRFLNNRFNIQAKDYVTTDPSERFLQRMDNILQRSKSTKVVEVAGKKITTSVPSDSKHSIEIELQSVDRSKRESMDAAASRVYQFALFKRKSHENSPRRSDETNDLLRDTCHKFITAHPDKDEDIEQLKLKADCLKSIKGIVDANALNKSGQITFFGSYTHNFQAKGIAQFRTELQNFQYVDKSNEEVLIDKHFLNTLFQSISDIYATTAERKDAYKVAHCCSERKRADSTQKAYNKIEKTLKVCNFELQKERSKSEEEGEMHEVDLCSTPSSTPRQSFDDTTTAPANIPARGMRL